MRKKLLRLLRIAPLALLFAGVASAQTTGTVLGVVTDHSTGKPVAGAVIIATSPNLQGQQTAVTDANGNYRLVQLPPGEYALMVQLGGYKDAQRSDIVIRLDKTIRANITLVPEAVQMEEQVVRTGAAPVVNIGAAESGAVVSREFVANVPVGRNVEAVASVVPQAVVDRYGVGFAGAQSAENTYILDGLNVTDPVYGTFAGNPRAQSPTPSLLNAFVEEIDVKTGGYSAEYGRATGGVLNVVTRSGSNEFHGSVFSSWTPRFLVQPDGQVTGSAGEAIAWRSVPGEGSYDLDLGFEVGGPIMKDRLWFYAGFAPVMRRYMTERFLRSNVSLRDDAGTPFDEDDDTCANTEDFAATGLCRQTDSDGRFIQNRIPGSAEVVEGKRTTYQFTGKLTYLLDENNNFTLSAFGMPSSSTAYGMTGAPSRRTVEQEENTLDLIGRYGGKFLDKRLIVEAVGGYHRNTSTPKDQAIGGIDSQFNTPALRFIYYRNINDFEENRATGACDADGAMGTDACPVFDYTIGGLSFLNDLTSTRLSGRVSGAYLFEAAGSHNAKVGVDVERTTYDVDKFYGGGFLFQHNPNVTAPAGVRSELTDPRRQSGLNVIATNRGYGFVNVPGGRGLDPSTVVAGNIVTESASTSTALFAQDSWQLPYNVTVNYGLRWEGQSMDSLSTPGDNGFDINDSWAPRVQAIWDFTGNGRGKLAGSWGRFYYGLPLDMADRLFATEQSLNFRVLANRGVCLPTETEAADGGMGRFDTKQLTFTGNADCVVANADAADYGYRTSGGQVGSVVAPDIKATSIDQFGAQVEYELFSDLSVGVEYQGRRQNEVIEDLSPDDGDSYYVGNPGRGSAFTGSDGVSYDPSNVVAVDLMTGRGIPVSFPKPERSYDSLTFMARKNFSQNWQASASYTWSSLRGNYAGPYRPEDDQLDPGLTSQFDIPSILANQTGYLPGDRTHQVKLFGSYTFNFGPRFNASAGAGYTGQSGTPVSALGGYNDSYDASQSFIVPRGQGGRTPFTHNVDLRGAVEYVITPPYAVKFSVDLFNVFNTEEIVKYDEDYTFDFVQPVQGIDCEGVDAAGSGNPVAKLQNACPDLKYLKTMDGRPVTVNTNWGRAAPGTASFQVPFSMRFGLSLSF